MVCKIIEDDTKVGLEIKINHYIKDKEVISITAVHTKKTFLGISLFNFTSTWSYKVIIVTK